MTRERCQREERVGWRSEVCLCCMGIGVAFMWIRMVQECSVLVRRPLLLLHELLEQELLQQVWMLQ
jgi:hypothetical protein